MPDSQTLQGLFHERISLARAVDWLLKFVELSAGQPASFEVRPEYLLILHKICADGLVAEPGLYRKRRVIIRGSKHIPPPPEKVPGHMKDFFLHLNKMWATASPIQISAYCLWRLNWIHPFQNGNGRTARLFSYMLLSMRVGRVLHGKRGSLVPEILGDGKRDEYIGALQAYDAGSSTEMENLISKELHRQMVDSYK